MPFSNIEETSKSKVELIPLMDMVFILLVFFLVTMFVTQLSKQEQKLDIPTPKNEPGRAQIMLQILPGGDFVWIDSCATSIVNDVEDNFGYLSPQMLRAKKVEEVLKRSRYTPQNFEKKLTAFVEQANADPNASYFVLIRCPNEVPYFRVVDVIKYLTDCVYHNIDYGCVGGTIGQIENCRQIKVVREGKRENLWIDF